LGGTEDRLRRKTILWASIVTNLGILGFFKYHDFFITAFTDAFTLFGSQFHGRTLGLILPVGISFYTFQSLSYSIDVYRRHIHPSKDPIEFGAYLIFFPQLVAGPIERATSLLPQFQRDRSFNISNAIDGSRQMLWGLFKKIAIADQCAPVVDRFFDGGGDASANQLVMAAIMFAFQIYGDFSGYSDIAIGCARLFGIDLMRNFAYPYFSRDIAEFWRRWHISLSTWFRDYLYIPLGGSRGVLYQRIRNVMIIFLVSGFWHGANYTFIAWGTIHGLLFLPLLIAGSNRHHTNSVAQDRKLPRLREAGAMISTFAFVTLAWIFFRANSIGHAFGFIQDIILGYMKAPKQLFVLPHTILHHTPLMLIILMLGVEWIQRDKTHGLADLQNSLPVAVRWAAYYSLTVIVAYHFGTQQSFIYFQF
jgi:alginate O-acetyltransferase complex protein AlgI